MSEQVELLPLAKEQISNKKGTSLSSPSKKEGISLFDSLLVKSKSDLEESSTQKSLNKDTTKTQTQKDISSQAKNNLKEDNKNLDNKDLDDTLKTKKDSTVKKEIINEQGKDSSKTSEIKKDNTTSSLLDRMILEANKKVSKNDLKKVETEKKETDEQKLLKSDDEKVQEDEDLNTEEVPKKDDLKKEQNENKNITNNKNDLKDETSLESLKNIEATLNKDKNSKNEKTDNNFEIKKERLSKKNIENTQNLNSNIKNDDLKVQENLEKNNIEKKVTEDKVSSKDENLQQEQEKDLKVKNAKPDLNLEKNENSPKENKKADEKILNQNELQKPSGQTTEIKTTKEQNLSETLNSNNKNIKESEEQIKDIKGDKTLDSLDEEALSKTEQRVNLDKNSLDETKDENRAEKSEKKDSITPLVQEKKESVLLNKNPNDIEKSEKQNSSQKSNDFMTNIFLSTQKNSVLSQMIMNKSEGVKTLKGAESLKDIKEGAETLDLGLKDLDIQIDEDSSIKEIKQRVQNNSSILNKLALNTNKTEKVIDEALQTTKQVSSSNTVNNTTDSKDESVDINVNSNLALSIQNRIIGAKQQLSSMMSDIARSMYENYKPPVTAFRINLIPAQLGHIAILMKNDKENSLSINLTLSQSSTHDSMVENQSSLRDALHKTFNSGQNQTSFNLDFSMEGGNSSQTYSQEDNNPNTQNNSKQHSSDEIMESIIQNQDVAEDLNYM